MHILPATQKAQLCQLLKIASISGGGGGGGDVTNFFKLPLIYPTCEVYEDPNGGTVLNVNMSDIDDTLYPLTGKHFTNTSYDGTTNTWTSNDGTLTLKSTRIYMYLDNDGSTFMYPTVFFFYGYFPNYDTGTGEEELGIFMTNDPNGLSGLGTMLCIGETELMWGYSPV